MLITKVDKKNRKNKFVFIGLSPTPAKIAPPPQSILGRNRYQELEVIEQWLIRHLEGTSTSPKKSPIGMIFASFAEVVLTLSAHNLSILLSPSY